MIHLKPLVSLNLFYLEPELPGYIQYLACRWLNLNFYLKGSYRVNEIHKEMRSRKWLQF